MDTAPSERERFGSDRRHTEFGSSSTFVDHATMSQTNEFMQKENNFHRTNKFDMESGWGLYNLTNDTFEWTSLMVELDLQKAPYELQTADLIQKEFSTLSQAEKFFCLYSKAMGFSVRKSHKRKTPNGEVKGRTWLCSKEGKRDNKFLNMCDRKKEPKSLTREDCKVEFRVNRSRGTERWVVKEFVTQHSHPLAIAKHIQYLRSNRQISHGALKTAKSLKSAGVRTCHIMGYMANMVGGFDNMRFIMKDLYNKLATDEEFLVDDLDASKAIGYLEHKSEMDTNFYGRYTVDSERRLQHLFWADSISRSDYRIFGHALSFDTTYRSNKYGKPLLVFVGVNHHFKTTIFALVLLENETVDSYKWALSTFIECMDGVRPRTVITDGDLAMKAALNEYMPDTVHRLCSLHLQQNVVSNIKSHAFPTAFTKLMYRHYCEAEFECNWSMVLKDFGLQNNRWIASMYEKRHSWADTFLRGNFFAGMRTTQRSEGMHAYLKSKIKCTTKLTGFVRGMEGALAWLRQKEAEDDYISGNTKPVTNVTNMTEIEVLFSELYTREMFFKVRDEIKREGQYIVKDVHYNNEDMTYLLTKYTTKRIVRQVNVDNASMMFNCSCNSFPTTGVPCRHIFATLKAMHVTTVPEPLLCKRWMKNAKVMAEHNQNGPQLMPWERKLVEKDGRFGHLMSKLSELAYLGAENETLFKAATVEFDRARVLLTGIFAQTSTTKKDEQGLRNPRDVNNPAYANAKGSGGGGRFGGRARKKCSNCQRRGHNKKTCKHKTRTDDNDGEDDTQDLGEDTQDLGEDTQDITEQNFTFSANLTHDHGEEPWWGKPFGIR